MKKTAVKEYKTKPTRKQKLAFKKSFENLGNIKPLGTALLEAGYSKNVANNPIIVTQSKGFKQLAEEAGLSDSMILTALADDIKQKPRDRSKELAIACKVKGLFKADNDQRSNPVNIPDADFIEIIRAYKIRK